MTVASKPGTRLRSAVSEVTVVVVRPVADEIELRCGGRPMLDVDDPAALEAVDGGQSEEVLLGKRYFDEATGLELLCTKAGAGPLTVDGRNLEIRGAKALPSSD